MEIVYDHFIFRKRCKGVVLAFHMTESNVQTQAVFRQTLVRSHCVLLTLDFFIMNYYLPSQFKKKFVLVLVEDTALSSCGAPGILFRCFDLVQRRWSGP